MAAPASKFKVYVAPRLPVGAALLPEDALDEPCETQVLVLHREQDVLGRIAEVVAEVRKTTTEYPACVLVGWKSYLCLIWEAKQRLVTAVSTSYDGADGLYVAGVHVYCDPRSEHTVVALPKPNGIGTPSFRAVVALRMEQ